MISGLIPILLLSFGPGSTPLNLLQHKRRESYRWAEVEEVSAQQDTA